MINQLFQFDQLLFLGELCVTVWSSVCLLLTFKMSASTLRIQETDSHPVSVVTPCWTRAADQHLAHWEPTRGPTHLMILFPRFSLFSSAGIPSIVDFLTPFIPTAVFCLCFSYLACEDKHQQPHSLYYLLQIMSKCLNSHNDKYSVL